MSEAAERRAEPQGEPVPKVVAPPPGHPRFPLFDSLRAIAVFAVLFHHMGFITGVFAKQPYGPTLAHLNIGVVIFFVISGFLLYRPFVAHRFGGAAPPRVRDYGRRRALRILPGYWVALTVLAIYPGLVGVSSASTWGIFHGLFAGKAWVFYGLVQTYPVFDPPTACGVGGIPSCGIIPAWSLAVEAAFYVTLPLFAIAMRRLLSGRSPRTMITVELGALAALAVASLAVLNYSLDDVDHFWLGFNLPGTFIWFAFGMSLAVLSAAFWGRSVRLLDRNPGLAWLAAIGLFALVAYVLVPSNPFEPRSHFNFILERLGYGIIAALLVAPAVFGDPEVGLVRRILANPVIAWLGLVSYAIFLYQVSVGLKVFSWLAPGVSLLELTALTIAITVPIAAASYYLVEKQLLRFK